MKKLILLVALICASITAMAGDFIVHDGKLVWQGVFESEKDLSALEEILVTNGKFFDIINTGDRITCRCDRLHVDPREFGHSIGSTPIFVTANDLSFFCTIQAKDGRYRVTVEQFVLTNNRTGGFLEEGKTERMEDYAVSGENLKGVFKKKPAEIYDALFTKIFTIEEKSYIDDNW